MKLLNTMIRERANVVGLPMARKEALAKALKLLHEKDTGGNYKVNLRSLNFQGIYHAFADTFGHGRELTEEEKLRESMHVASEFNILLSNVVTRILNDRPRFADTFVTDQLVENFPSRKKKERFGGLQAMEAGREFADGQSVPEVKFLGERGYEAPEPVSYGAMISLHWKVQHFDESNLFLTNIEDIRDKAAYDREIKFLKGVIDHADNKRYYPIDPITKGPVVTNMYRTSAGTAYYNNNITQQAIPIGNSAKWQLVLDNFTARTDEQGQKIPNVPRVFLFDTADTVSALKMLGIAVFRIGDSSAMEQGNITIANVLKSQPVAVFSPYLTGLTGTAGTWFAFSDPKAAFKNQQIKPLMVERAPDAHSDMFNLELFAKWKVTYTENITVVSDRGVLKCTPS